MKPNSIPGLLVSHPEPKIWRQIGVCAWSLCMCTCVLAHVPLFVSHVRACLHIHVYPHEHAHVHMRAHNTYTKSSFIKWGNRGSLKWRNFPKAIGNVKDQPVVIPTPQPTFLTVLLCHHLSHRTAVWSRHPRASIIQCEVLNDKGKVKFWVLSMFWFDSLPSEEEVATQLPLPQVIQGHKGHGGIRSLWWLTFSGSL